MNARRVRVLLGDEDIAALIGTGGSPPRAAIEAVGAVAEAFGERWLDIAEAAPRIAPMAVRRARLAAAREKVLERIFGESGIVHGLHRGGWKERAGAAAELERAGLWPDPLLADRPEDAGEEEDAPALRDGRLLAEALAVAAGEAADRGFLEAADGLRETEWLAESGGPAADAWEKHFGRCVKRLAANARAAGRPGLKAAADIMVAEAVMRGRLLQKASGASSEDVMALGAAGAAPVGEAARAPRDLFMRRLGAAGIGAALGFVHGWRAPAASAAASVEAVSDGDDFDEHGPVTVVVDRFLPLRFKRGFLDRLAPLAVHAACERLRAEAVDPKVPGHVRAACEALSDALERAAVGRRIEALSFARAAGLEERTPEAAEPEEGALLHDAAPVGPHPPVLVCVGRKGREFRCRAVADGLGRLVGYRAIDPLSSDFHGEPTRVVYGLDGRLAGWLDRGRFRRGAPSFHLLTVTERLEKKEAVR